jgi:hypothetical protein
MSLVAHFFKLSMVLRQDTYIISSSHLKWQIATRFEKLSRSKEQKSENPVDQEPYDGQVNPEQSDYLGHLIRIQQKP